MSSQVVKLTVSIPQDLISVTNEIAKERKLSRSKLVTMCLQKMADEHFRSEMAEGYKAIAGEQKEIAALTRKRQSEIVPEW